MRVYEKELRSEKSTDGYSLEEFQNSIFSNLDANTYPIRCAVTNSSKSSCNIELGVAESVSRKFPSIFEFQKREIENTKEFNAVFLVPTGIGAEIGGHAGDSTAACKLFSASCDNLVTHPNVVNASDINEIPLNAMYVEGSVVTRLLMGTVGLSKVRSNRILVCMEDHKDELFTNAAVNAVNAARATYGLECSRIIKLNPNIQLTSNYTSNGTAVGHVDNIDALFKALDEYRNEYDAVAIASIIKVPREYHAKYFKSNGAMINPWGGVEAILTHTISTLYNIPTAHSPMFEDQLVANFDPGVVDSRMAAEAISLTFMQCILKGLQKAPKIVTDESLMNHHNVFTASDIDCLIIPDGVLGIPTLAALKQGIKVIAVRNNKNIMHNDLTTLSWDKGQFMQVDNYLEAVGAMTALKEGLALDSIQRPIETITANTLDEIDNRSNDLSYSLFRNYDMK